jgi:hypothetical protein
VRLLVRHADVVAVRLCVLQPQEALLGAEQTGVHGRVSGGVGLPVEVDVAELADLLAVAVQDGLAAPAECRIDVEGHGRGLPGRAAG